MWRLIVAEQARARRLHPDNHAGHPDNTFIDNWRILQEEVWEVAFAKDANLIWELVQVAGVAAAWAERLMDDSGLDLGDLMRLIEGTEQ